jgi:hypothetical protein
MTLQDDNSPPENSPTIKVISIKHPFAQLIFEPHPDGQKFGPRWKQHETRSWATHYRGTLAIATCLQQSTDVGNLLAAALEKHPIDLAPWGCIIGTVEVVGCQKVEEAEGLDPFDIISGRFVAGHYCWKLEQAQLLPRPIAWKGRQGMMTLDDTTTRMITEQR